MEKVRGRRLPSDGSSSLMSLLRPKSLNLMYVSYTQDLASHLRFQRSAAECSPVLYRDGSTLDKTEQKYDPLRVEIGHCFQHLLDDVTGIHFRVVGLFDDSLQQFPTKRTNSKRMRICYRSIITIISSSLSKMS